jgi:hypothetical protein
MLVAQRSGAHDVHHTRDVDRGQPLLETFEHRAGAIDRDHPAHVRRDRRDEPAGSCTEIDDRGAATHAVRTQDHEIIGGRLVRSRPLLAVVGHNELGIEVLDPSERLLVQHPHAIHSAARYRPDRTLTERRAAIIATTGGSGPEPDVRQGIRGASDTGASAWSLVRSFIGPLVASCRSTRTEQVVVVRLEPLAAEHVTWLGEFLVSHNWPFHAGTVDRDLVTERLRQGYYDGPGRATFSVTDGAQRLGLVRVEDLHDPHAHLRSADRRRSPRSRPRDRGPAGAGPVGVRHARRRAARRDHPPGQRCDATGSGLRQGSPLPPRAGPPATVACSAIPCCARTGATAPRPSGLERRTRRPGQVVAHGRSPRAPVRLVGQRHTGRRGRREHHRALTTTTGVK